MNKEREHVSADIWTRQPYPNILRSGFHGHHYVGFSPMRNLWRIARTTDPAGNWIAHDDAGKRPPIYAFTLKGMSLKLSHLEDQPNG